MGRAQLRGWRRPIPIFRCAARRSHGLGSSPRSTTTSSPSYACATGSPSAERKSASVRFNADPPRSDPTRAGRPDARHLVQRPVRGRVRRGGCAVHVRIPRGLDRPARQPGHSRCLRAADAARVLPCAGPEPIPRGRAHVRHGRRPHRPGRRARARAADPGHGARRARLRSRRTRLRDEGGSLSPPPAALQARRHAGLPTPLRDLRRKKRLDLGRNVPYAAAFSNRSNRASSRVGSGRSSGRRGSRIAAP
jgi:hypothetical protein